jgi:hypothetical protein
MSDILSQTINITDQGTHHLKTPGFPQFRGRTSAPQPHGNLIKGASQSNFYLQGTEVGIGSPLSK